MTNIRDEQDFTGYLYKIENLINKKIYIGQTTRSVQGRWEAHCNPNSQCPAISAAIKKYGKDNFSIEVINCCMSMEELNIAEIEAIKQYDCLAPKGYNLQSGGLNGFPSEETRRKMSAWQIGKKLSERTKLKIAQSHKGKTGNESQRQKLLSDINPHRKIKSDMIPEILRLMGQKEPIDSIALKYGVSCTTIYHVTRNHRKTRRSPIKLHER